MTIQDKVEILSKEILMNALKTNRHSMLNGNFDEVIRHTLARVGNPELITP